MQPKRESVPRTPSARVRTHMREITSLDASERDLSKAFLSSSLDHNIVLWAPNGHTGALHPLRNLNVGAPVISACMSSGSSRNVIAVTVSISASLIFLTFGI